MNRLRYQRGASHQSHSDITAEQDLEAATATTTTTPGSPLWSSGAGSTLKVHGTGQTRGKGGKADYEDARLVRQSPRSRGAQARRAQDPKDMDAKS